MVAWMRQRSASQSAGAAFARTAGKASSIPVTTATTTFMTTTPFRFSDDFLDDALRLRGMVGGTKRERSRAIA
jgi:hypothetical protein